MLQRERGGATALTTLKLTSLSRVKEGTAQVKRCWSHVCNEGVLCCNDSALSLSSIHRPAGSATEWFYNLMIQISYLKSLYRLIPPLLMVTGDQLSQLSTGLWSRGRDVRIAITMRLSMSRSPWWMSPLWWWSCWWLSAQDARLLPGALGWASLIMFYRLTSQLGLSQPSLHLFSGLVIRHCPSSPLLLFRLGLNHRLRFPVKNQLNNLPIGIG